MNKYGSKRGFTLIELLVVISIILIASSIIFIGGNGGAGAALSSSTRIASGIAKGARGQAILKNAKTRLIIYSDDASNADEEKYLRYFGIVYADPADPNQQAPTSWIAATQGTSLPEGIYFDPDLSEGNKWPKSTMKLEYPRIGAETAGSGDDFYYYEFNSNGTIASEFLNAWLVLRAGILKPNASNVLELSFDAEQESLVSALILRRSGTTTSVTEPSHILP